MMDSWQSLLRAGVFWSGAWAVLPLHGADTGQRIFEGVVDSADAVFGDALRPDGVFAGSFVWSVGADGAVELADLEYTVDEHHVVGWEGHWRKGDGVEILLSTFPGSEERAVYVRWAVHQGERGEHPGWAEFWFAADSVEDLASDLELEGYFRLAVFLEEDWAFAKGWFLSGEADADAADPVLRAAFLEGLVATLRAELAGTQERLAESEETLRQVRAQQSGMVSTIEFLATERQRLESEVDRLTGELETRGALPERIIDLEATLALMEADLESVRGENLRLAELSARAEAARLREHEARMQAERLLEAVPAAFTVESEPPPPFAGPPAHRRENAAPMPTSRNATAEMETETSAEAGPAVRPNIRRGSLRR